MANCPVYDCANQPFPGRTFCSSHWAAIPAPVKQVIWASFFDPAAVRVATAWLTVQPVSVPAQLGDRSA
jgi:hypothetical protein